MKADTPTVSIASPATINHRQSSAKRRQLSATDTPSRIRWQMSACTCSAIQRTVWANPSTDGSTCDVDVFLINANVCFRKNLRSVVYFIRTFITLSQSMQWNSFFFNSNLTVVGWGVILFCHGRHDVVRLRK